MCKRHTMPHSAQPQHTNYWALRTRKRSTGRSGRQKAATRRNMRREERVTVHGPVKEQQPDGMSHRGGASHCTHTEQVIRVFLFHSTYTMRYLDG